MLSFQAVIEKKFSLCVTRHRRSAKAFAKFLGFLFYEQRFQQFEQDYPHLTGFDFVEAVLRYFDFPIRLREDERARIPSTGRVVRCGDSGGRACGGATGSYA